MTLTFSCQLLSSMLMLEVLSVCVSIAKMRTIFCFCLCFTISPIFDRKKDFLKFFREIKNFFFENDNSDSLFHLRKGHRQQVGGLPRPLASRIHRRVRFIKAHLPKRFLCFFRKTNKSQFNNQLNLTYPLSPHLTRGELP